MKKHRTKAPRRPARRDVGAELLQAVRDIKAGHGRRYVVEVAEATNARQKLGASQAEFARLLGVSLRTLQDWEQGRRQPSGAAKVLLRVVVVAPAAVRRAIAA